jgi:hypothetical protein
MMKKQLEDAQRLEVDTRLMNAASKHCIKIERPSKSPKKHLKIIKLLKMTG